MNANFSNQLKPLSVHRQIHDRADDAFTLTELLVVLATLAILAVVLLPAFATQPARAKAFQCLNNLRQMAVAWTLYSGDFNERLALSGGVPNTALSMTDPNINNGNWVHGIMGTLYGATFISNTDSNLVKAGSLFPYTKSLGVYKCPADTKTSKLGASVRPTTRSMSMNCWLNPIVPWSTTYARIYRRQGDITLPAPVNCWVFLDENPGTINDGWMVCDPFAPNASAWVDIPASYHNSAGGLSFADGHSILRKWRDPVILAKNISMPGLLTGHPEIDLDWFQSVSTAHK